MIDPHRGNKGEQGQDKNKSCSSVAEKLNTLSTFILASKVYQSCFGLSYTVFSRHHGNSLLPITLYYYYAPSSRVSKLVMLTVSGFCYKVLRFRVQCSVLYAYLSLLRGQTCSWVERLPSDTCFLCAIVIHHLRFKVFIYSPMYSHSVPCKITKKYILMFVTNSSTLTHKRIFWLFDPLNSNVAKGVID